jgi:Mg/Co/Ni transporter MgtE
LESYQQLIKEHLVVTVFLTMLVGAGGNAGNQSAIKVIRGLATGTIRASWPSLKTTVQQQAIIGLLLGSGLSVAGFARVYITNGDLQNSFAISISLFIIVMTSVCSGTVLPFALARLGIDPANAGTCIQVVMDILGVAITCFTCHLILDQLSHSLIGA